MDPNSEVVFKIVTSEGISVDFCCLWIKKRGSGDGRHSASIVGTLLRHELRKLIRLTDTSTV